MVKRNAHAVLLLSGQVGESQIQFFVWDTQSGTTLAVFREIISQILRDRSSSEKLDITC